MSMGGRLRLWALGATVICCALVGAPPQAQGQGNLELGPFRILTQLDFSGEYNDNIVLAPEDRARRSHSHVRSIAGHRARSEPGVLQI